MRFLIITGFVIFSLISVSQNATNDTVYELSPVQITSDRLDDFSAGLKIKTVDSLSLRLSSFSTLDELISQRTAVYIKSYGQGSLATISFRGTNAAHTGIYWNGFNLNPPNLSSTDMSLIPVSFFNSVEVLYGASGSLFGSGNIGGNIQLKNNPVFDKGKKINVNLSAGSFHSYALNGNIQLSDNKWWSSTSFVYSNSNNDFPYKNIYGDNEVRENAAVVQYGLMQDINRKIGEKHLIGLSFWYQYTDREIPNTMVTRPSVATQNDESVRVSGKWKYFLNRGSFLIKAAYLRDEEKYSDPESQIEQNRNSVIITNTFITEANFQHNFGNSFKFDAGINLTDYTGQSFTYSKNHERRQVGLFASGLYKLPVNDLKLNLNLRQDFIEGLYVPFTPSLGMEGKIWNFIFGKANFSKNFRAPSFNDLYWEPYGNTELQPEISYNGELGLLLKNKTSNENLYSEFSGTVFNSFIDNWILWIPVDNNWSPENIQKVWSRGIEVEENAKFIIHNLTFKISLGYTYVKSTNMEKTGQNDQSFEKQLIYVPEHSANVNVDYMSKIFIISFNNSFTGKRYVTRDNLDHLPAYFISDVKIVKNFNIRKSSVSAGFDIYNIWDADYQVIQYYPVPGRNFRLSLGINIK